MKIKIELTEKQLMDITNQENKRLGLPSINDMAFMSLRTELELKLMKELLKAAKKKNATINKN